MDDPAPMARPLTHLIDDVMATWGEPDEGRRAEGIVRCWHPDGALVSPPLEARGHEAIGSLLAAMQDFYPGHVLVRTTRVDAHHDTFRVGWEVHAGDGTVALSGIDIGIIDADRRLLRLTGFFGTPRALDEETAP
jgi:hypothetical protein